MSYDLPASSRLDARENGLELECLPYAVHHEDEGICLLVRIGPYRILLDCGISDLSPLRKGLKKSRQNGSRLPADLVLCSHAHPDHAKGLLALHRAFPHLPIYASDVTTQLLPLNWPEVNPKEIPKFCHALPWRSPVEFQEGLSAQLFPAGHLPGAAAILLTYTTQERSYTLLYTGDFFLSNSRLVEGLPLEELRGLEPDVLIIEGSYGTARHPHRRSQENQLAERINRAIANSCSVLLPTPTLGLGQEILMLLRSHHNFTGRDLDIWVDGTVATGCNAYLELLPYLPAAVQNFARHQPLFWDERVRPRMRRLSPEQRHTVGQSPCIVLTDETADLNIYCQPDTGPWVILLPEKPGHPSPLTHQPLESMLVAAGTSHQKTLSPQIETYLLAQHSDGPGTTQLIHNVRPQHVVFVHGSPTYLADLTSLEELQTRYHLHSPSAGTLVELPIGEMFLQPAPPETNYEGELNELGSVLTITLPGTITTSPRWRHFADTGIVEARWQGEELVLRGLSQRELMSQSSNRALPADLECCNNCRFQRGQRCLNQASPLFGFKVTLDGYCPAFERQTEEDKA
ncbi:MAG: MBL fold metallo-hydrolase [Chroococcidiopsidaceae cyanobacterium CP_BM_ER_R8_30]|nr:MBL fold metallo-hydrolase [Chroococcidiopsidaceae cyanobacterium CP_BM_ER_R8_30]